MKHATLPTIVALAALLGGCHHSASGSEDEHERESDEHGSEGGEESGTDLALTERYDATRNGARLTLEYDAQANSFLGTVENTTEQNLENMRVEVHLSNGKELGPTPAANLAPGAKQNVRLLATSTDFERWTAHPEVGGDEDGAGEHGHDHGAGDGHNH